MILEQIRVGGMDNFAYLMGCRATGEAAVVDPAFEPERLVARAAALGLRIAWVINTHGHHDHAGGNHRMVALTDARVAAHPAAQQRSDRRLAHDETLALGEVCIRALHTPGHTPDGLCLLVDDEALLTGDTLFVGECGRTDLPGSDAAALHHSFFEVLAALPDHLTVWPGHDYGTAPHSTLGRERAENYTLKPRSVEEFVAFMAEP